MRETLEFPDLLRLIDDRSTAFLAAIASAPSLDAQVPTCPEWTLYDLARHLGAGRRSWAATIAAGPDATAKIWYDGPAPSRDREELLAWLAASTRELLDALREAGPDRGCWVGWGDSQAPRTAGAVARHQVQEFAVHTYDAQLTAGSPQPLPEEVALDGVEEFQFTCVATTSPWPHKPAIIDHHATEGRSWRLWLSADGARAARLPVPGIVDGEDAADAAVQGTASELILWYYDRVPLDPARLHGDLRVIDQLVEWEPE